MWQIHLCKAMHMIRLYLKQRPGASFFPHILQFRLHIHICNKIKILSVKLYLKWLVLCGKTCWSLQWQRIMGNASLTWKLVEDFVISPTRPQTFDSSTVKGHNNIPYPPLPTPNLPLPDSDQISVHDQPSVTSNIYREFQKTRITNCLNSHITL